MRENDMEKLRLVYELITHVPSEVNPMLEQLEEYIWYAGTNELQASAEILVKVGYTCIPVSLVFAGIPYCIWA
ncbi:unnamed protein product [Dibothriocephalus latus]|uniref:Uncharacterized protein n=1 Tax=Dibothriocephalus latus TaxID=60516 RepID=A0A3P7NFV9_DIBLA|nr:unnamed protein product [Dibothriocephalus latus]